MAVAYTDVLTQNDFSANGSYNPDGVTTQAGVPLQFAYRVLPKEKIAAGTGEISFNGVANSGVLFVSIKDNAATPVQIEGTYRLLYANASKTQQWFLQGSQLDQIRSSKTARDAANVLPMKTTRNEKGKTVPWVVGEYGYVILEFTPSTLDKVIKVENCDIQIPITVWQE
jgi:hypothetical protein